MCFHDYQLYTKYSDIRGLKPSTDDEPLHALRLIEFDQPYLFVFSEAGFDIGGKPFQMHLY
jgi:hypothetical protein